MEKSSARAYCLRHPGEVVSTFGFAVFLRLLAGGSKSLLQRVIEAQEGHGIAMPGQPGNAYRLSALIEFRVARIYGLLAARFADRPAVRDFYRQLQDEEKEHGRLMLLCLYTVTNDPPLRYVPSIRDPEMRRLLGELRKLQRRTGEMGLNEALVLTEQLERSEINVIFGQLLAQADQPQSRFFARQLGQSHNHAVVVPERIRALRATLH